MPAPPKSSPAPPRPSLVTTMPSETSVYRLPPGHYLHVLDQTSHVTRVETGPQTFVRKDNEQVVLSPSPMVVVPPNHYCVIENPVLKDEENQVVKDNYGQVKLVYADKEYRFAQDPFPLYPGEKIGINVTKLQVVPKLTALKLSVISDFEDEKGNKRTAGDEFLFRGPGTYKPRKEVEVISTIKATIIRRNEALRLRSINCPDAGREWLVREIGAYLPSETEEIVSMETAVAVTDTRAVHVRCLHSFKDVFGKERKSGDEYLITKDITDAFVPDVHEEIVGQVDITTLNSRQYCVILNNQIDQEGGQSLLCLGHRKVIKGETSFFLRPGEELEDGCIKDVHVLSEDEGIVLTAREAFKDGDTERKAGDRWMLKGPMDYIPPVEVVVESIRKAIPLHENEGVYVRNIRNGSVRAVIGQTYMLAEDEELWPKPMPAMVRALLSRNRDALADRGDWVNPEKERRKAAKEDSANKTSNNENVVNNDDPTRVVSFQVPHNAAVQIYDYRSKQSRVVFGPDLVMLMPNEEFTQLSLSGGKPKRPNMIRAIALLLGPDFCSDIIHVETSDHARLQLTLSYNYRFDATKEIRESREQSSKLFCVSDFIGDMCNSIASRIRGAVSGVTFDDFHKNSARVIQAAAFGVEAKDDTSVGSRPKIKSELRYDSNHLVVTSIDVRSVEPVDQKTRDSLLKSVTLAIEITTQSQEAAAKREAERVDQEARGRLERQRISDEAQNEKARKELVGLKAASAAVESSGQAKAEAQARAEAAHIEADAAVQAAKLKAEAMAVQSQSELERLTRARAAELEFVEAQNRLLIEKSHKMASIESDKFKNMVDALGADTIRALANGPQEHQVKMLQSLGLSSALITDGRTPINLLSTATGLLGDFTKGVENKVEAVEKK